MKKSVLILSFLLVLGIGARGQELLTGSDYPGSIACTIVRDYQGSATISYVEAGGKHYFSFADASATIVNQEIDSRLTVKDFVVRGRYVYFCGENNQPQAIVGWFKVPSFFAGTEGYHLRSSFSTFYSPSIKTLVGICVYDDRGTSVVVAVGESQSGKAAVVSLRGQEGVDSGWGCEVGEPWETTERMFSVCVTDHYVVSAGTIFNDGDGISLRIFDKQDLFATGGTQERFHRYSSEDSDPLLDYPLTDNASTRLALTHIKGDSVAVMAEWRYRGSQSQSFSDGLLLHVYDLGSTLNLTNPLAELSVVVHQPAASASDREVVGLRYNTTTSRLHYAVRGSAGLDMLGDLPIPPALIDYRCLSGVDVRSLDGRAASPYGIAQGVGTVGSNRLKSYRYALGTSNVSCASPNIIRPDLTHKFREKNHLYPLMTTQYEVSFSEIMPLDSLDTHKITDCQN